MGCDGSPVPLSQNFLELLNKLLTDFKATDNQTLDVAKSCCYVNMLKGMNLFLSEDGTVCVY